MPILTRVTNNFEARRLPYIPPNGMVLQSGQTVDIPGLLDTELYLGDDYDILDTFYNHVLSGRITVLYIIPGISSSIGLAAVDKDMTPAATSGNYVDTGLTITSTPVTGSYVCIMVNGVMEALSNGTRNKSFYFSDDGGATGKLFTAIVAGDSLYFNGIVAKYDLAITDRISFVYEPTVLTPAPVALHSGIRRRFTAPPRRVATTIRELQQSIESVPIEDIPPIVVEPPAKVEERPVVIPPKPIVQVAARIVRKPVTKPVEKPVPAAPVRIVFERHFESPRKRTWVTLTAAVDNPAPAAAVFQAKVEKQLTRPSRAWAHSS